MWIIYMFIYKLFLLLIFTLLSIITNIRLILENILLHWYTYIFINTNLYIIYNISLKTI